jgi:hypothetical protein
MVVLFATGADVADFALMATIRSGSLTGNGPPRARLQSYFFRWMSYSNQSAVIREFEFVGQ